MKLGPIQRKPWYSYLDCRPHLWRWLCLTSDHSGCWQRTWSYIAGGGGGWQSTSGQWLEGWQELVLLPQRRSRWSERIVDLVTCLLWFETTRRNGIWSNDTRIWITNQICWDLQGSHSRHTHNRNRCHVETILKKGWHKPPATLLGEYFKERMQSLWTSAS